MPLLFIDSYKKEYKSDGISLSNCVAFILYVAIILLPLFACYATADFWPKIREYTEQPMVEFTGKYIINTIAIQPNNIYINKFESSKDLINNEYRQLCTNNNNENICSVLPDFDITQTKTINSETRKNDKLKFSITFTETNNQQTRNIKLMLFMKYFIRNKAKILFYPMVYIDLNIDAGESNKQFNLLGTLELKQKSPIYAFSKNARESYDISKEENNPFMPDLESPFNLEKIYDKFEAKNFTTKFNYKVFNEQAEDNQIIINLEITIPKMQKIMYFSNLFDCFKDAWIQYLYVFIPIYFVIYSLLKFTLVNNVLSCYSKSDLKNKLK